MVADAAGDGIWVVRQLQASSISSSYRQQANCNENFSDWFFFITKSRCLSLSLSLSGRPTTNAAASPFTVCRRGHSPQCDTFFLFGSAFFFLISISIVYLRSSNKHSLYHPHYIIPITCHPPVVAHFHCGSPLISSPGSGTDDYGICQRYSHFVRLFACLPLAIRRKLWFICVCCRFVDGYPIPPEM